MPNTAEEAEIYVDGASRGNPGPAAIGYIIRTPDQVLKHGEYIGEMTNNQAEYTGLIKALEKTLSLGVKKVLIYSDSVLLVKQVRGEYRVRNQKLASYHRKVLEYAAMFETFEIMHVDREKNSEADRLAQEALKAFMRRKYVGLTRSYPDQG